MRKNFINEGTRRIALASAAVLIAGCSINTDEVATSFVAPGKYELHSCQQIQQLIRERAAQAQKLQDLTDQAKRSPGGDVAATLAYGTDYATTYGEMRVLQDASMRKNCDDRSRSISERSMW